MGENRDYNCDQVAKNPRKRDRRRVEANARQLNSEKYGKVGTRKEGDTPLYVKCLVCEGKGVGTYDNSCLCENGFVLTGFTQERYDRLVAATDKLLLALDESLRNLNPSERLSVLRANGYTDDDVETARSRSK